MSRLLRYQGASRSRNRMSWPRLAKALSNARKVVAWPLPHDDDRLRPRTTSFMPRPPRGGLPFRALAARRPRLRDGRRCALSARVEARLVRPPEHVVA